jgi:hypothetical protein
VARGGQEPGLREIGLVGEPLRAGQLLVETGQLLRSLLDALLQSQVLALALLLLVGEIGNVRIGVDVSPARQPVRAHRDHAPARIQLDANRPGIVQHAMEPDRHKVVHVAGPISAALRVDPDDLLHADADPDELRRKPYRSMKA